MPITVTFLNTCRTAITGLPELTTYRAAVVALGAAAKASRPALWYATYGDNQAGLSPAYRLRKAIRDTVRANADATVSPLEQEEAYRTLAADYVSVPDPPKNAEQEAAEYAAMLVEDAVS